MTQGAKIQSLGFSLSLHAPLPYTEVQRVSFVGYTGGKDGSLGLWNLQNLHAVPPYSTIMIYKLLYSRTVSGKTSYLASREPSTTLLLPGCHTESNASQVRLMGGLEQPIASYAKRFGVSLEDTALAWRFTLSLALPGVIAHYRGAWYFFCKTRCLFVLLANA